MADTLCELLTLSGDLDKERGDPLVHQPCQLTACEADRSRTKQRGGSAIWLGNFRPAVRAV